MLDYNSGEWVYKRFFVRHQLSAPSAGSGQRWKAYVGIQGWPTHTLSAGCDGEDYFTTGYLLPSTHRFPTVMIRFIMTAVQCSDKTIGYVMNNDVNAEVRSYTPA